MILNLRFHELNCPVFNAAGNSCTIGANHGASQFMPVRAIHAPSVQIMAQANSCPLGQFMHHRCKSWCKPIHARKGNSLWARIDKFDKNQRYRACPLDSPFYFCFSREALHSHGDGTDYIQICAWCYSASAVWIRIDFSSDVCMTPVFLYILHKKRR